MREQYRQAINSWQSIFLKEFEGLLGRHLDLFLVTTAGEDVPFESLKGRDPHELFLACFSGDEVDAQGLALWIKWYIIFGMENVFIRLAQINSHVLVNENVVDPRSAMIVANGIFSALEFIDVHFGEFEAVGLLSAHDSTYARLQLFNQLLAENLEDLACRSELVKTGNFAAFLNINPLFGTINRILKVKHLPTAKGGDTVRRQRLEIVKGQFLRGVLYWFDRGAGDGVALPYFTDELVKNVCFVCLTETSGLELSQFILYGAKSTQDQVKA
jgi:hypothetical protein